MTVAETGVPTVAQLIHDNPDTRISGRFCGLCGSATIYQLGDFVACMFCDTTKDTRVEAGFA